MKVYQLIEYLKTLPLDLDVAYQKYSEQVILEPKDITIEELCEERPDGWIQDYRPDKPTKKYVVFPGN